MDNSQKPTVPKVPKKRRQRENSPPDEKYCTALFPCPGCSKRLQAKRWVGEGKQSKTLINVDSEWIIIEVSGDVCLPCVLCLMAEEGLETKDWKNATMTREQLPTKLFSRLRQHLARCHDLLARNPDAISMRNLAKEIVCKLIHDHPDQAMDSFSEVRYELLVYLKNNTVQIIVSTVLVKTKC